MFRRRRVFIWIVAMTVGWAVLVGRSPVQAGGKSRAATETVEYVLQRFGRKAVRGGAEAFARKIETAAARHGDDVFRAVRKIGPRALPLVEQAGAHGSHAARILARHGEKGATWIVSRPRALKLAMQHGDEAAEVLLKHAGGIAEPLVEKYGGKAVRALAATGPQGGRRLAMLAEADLAKMGSHSEALLEVIAKYGDRAMDFVWKNKGALTVGATLTAFLANPEPFLHTAEGMTQTVSENAVRPLAEIPFAAVQGVTAGTNWTVIILVTLGTGLGLAVARNRIRERRGNK